MAKVDKYQSRIAQVAALVVVVVVAYCGCEDASPPGTESSL
jgi:hypothetical protein